MAKLRLIIAVVGVLTFLLTLWAVPVGLIWLALGVVNTLWMRIVLGIMAIVWLTVIRPWRVFSREDTEGFLADLYRSIRVILNL